MTYGGSAISRKVVRERGRQICQMKKLVKDTVIEI